VIDSFVTDDGGSYAVFVAYCSLHQPGLAGEALSDKESSLVRKAHANLAALYLHAATWTLELTALPDGLTFSSGAPNVAPYAGRGWNFLEAHVSRFVKPAQHVLDLSKAATLPEGYEEDDVPQVELLIQECKAPRPPPLLPAEFRAAVAAKSFTDRDADLEVVCTLYEDAFRANFVVNEALCYDGLGWGDAEVEALCKVLAAEEMASCKSLWLSHNDGMTSAGLATLEKAFKGGALPNIETLHLLGSAVFDAGDEAKKSLREARPGIEMFFTSKLDGRGGNGR
jgi:hypothetical protein